MWFLYILVVMLVTYKHTASDFVEDLRRQLRGKAYNYSNSFFGPLLNFYVGGTPVTPSEYPWIAKVIHSRHKAYPHVCTAACIEPGIFVTAARCLVTLKVNYTSVIYSAKRFPVISFVLPSTPTRQYFDDVGFLVINHMYKTFPGIIKVFTLKRRTGNGFEWFDSSYSKFVDKVVGYGMSKADYRKAKADTVWDLRALTVIANLDICPRVFQDNLKSPEYRVPCYAPCDAMTLADIAKETCKSFHGNEGSAVISNEKPPRLIGVATWSNYEEKRQVELPVGFSVLNSVTFQNDLTCAQRIRNTDINRITPNYLQELCN